ncbi:WD-40 repeat protein [Kalymmatonema gypsitolerans NIES-4073]|nr:WD-40 repeat protein [Scytonema sp. NIES-4073]
MSAASKMGDEYQVGGSLSEKASTYVVRQADFELYQGLKALKFCYVLNSRQMGKSSLRVRTMMRLKREGFVIAAIEMGELCVVGATSELFFNSFISLLVSKFNLAIDDEQWCDSKRHILPSVRLNKFLEEEVLERLTQNIVIFIDEIDNLLSVDFKDDFFGFLCGCYNKRAENQKYHRLTFALLGVATPRELIGDTNRTPFNIETRAIELTGFQLHEAKPLESGLVGVANNPQAVMKEVLKWTGGQPFLTQWLCQLISTNSKFIGTATEAESVALIVQQCMIKNWLAQDKQQHLQTIRDRILANQNFACRLLGLYQQLLSGEIAFDGSPEQMQLQLSGLVVKRLQNLSIYNDIYRCVFNSTWVEQSLGNLRPYAEKFTAWETSGRDTSHLLCGQQLQDAKTWAVGKSLSDKDYQFLAASLELEEQQTQAALKEQKKANRILQSAASKAQQMIRVGSVILSVSLVGAAIAWLLGVQALHKQQEALSGTKLEQQGISNWLQFENGNEIDALVSALQNGQELKKLVKDEQSLEKYPAVSPVFALQSILNQIHERNRLFLGHKVNSISFSPDGKLIATAGYDGTTKLWNLSGQPFTTLKGHQASVNGVSFKPLSVRDSLRERPLASLKEEGTLIATASDDGTVRLWNLSGQQVAELKEHQRSVNSISFSPNGQMVASTGEDKTIRVWDLSGNQVLIFEGGPYSVSFSSDGKLITTAEEDGIIRLRNLSTQKVVVLKGNHGSIRSISFSPKNKLIATGGYDGTIRLWNFVGQQVAKFKGHRNTVNNVSFSPDGKLIASTAQGQPLMVRDLSGKQVIMFKGSQYQVSSASFSPDGKLIATAGEDGTLRLWDLSGKEFKKFKGHQRQVNNVTFSPNGKLIATVGDDETAKLWDLSGQVLTKFQGHLGKVWSVSFSPDGQLVATGGTDGTIRLWTLSGQQLTEFKAHQGWVSSISFSLDGKLIATAGDDKTARLWNLSGLQVTEFKPHKGWVYSVSFSPDGKLIATAGDDGTAKLWDLSGKLLRKYELDQGKIYSLSFSPDGKLLATAGADGTTRLWNLSGQQVVSLRKQSGRVKSVNFSPDGKLIATAGDDGTARVWNLSGQQVAEFQGNQDLVNSVSFSPDGKLIATAGTDGTVKLWRLESLDELLTRGCLWLKDYFISKPNELKQLEVCQNKH